MSNSWGSWDSSESTTHSGIQTGGWGGTGATVVTDGSPKSLSILPLIVMAVVLVFSSVLIFLSSDNLLLAVIGYVLTPFASFAVFAWATALDANLKMDVWYDRKQGKLIALRILAILSLIIGFVHMWDVATAIARFYAGGIA